MKGTRLLPLLLLAACGVPALQARPRAPAGQAKTLSKEQAMEVATEVERRGDDLRAAQYLQLAMAQGAGEAAVVPRLLATYIRGRQYRLAAQWAENYLRRRPGQHNLQLLLATLYEALGDRHSAIAQYRDLLAHAPDHAGAHISLAITLNAVGQDATTADYHYRRYLELQPHGPFAAQAQGALLAEVPR